MEQNIQQNIALRREEVEALLIKFIKEHILKMCWGKRKKKKKLSSLINREY